MATRATLKTWLLIYLGTDSDDPAFPAATLEFVLQQAANSLISAIQRANPDYLVKTVTLEPETSTSHVYGLSLQDTPIANFAFWRDVRWTDSAGRSLFECRLDELPEAGADYFSLYGTDEALFIETSPDSQVGENLWLRYTYTPVDMATDNYLPDGIPKQFHDVVALEALFAFGLGGEQQRPPELTARWIDRRADLLAHVSRRGSQPSRTKVYADTW